jgi:hypothetical protein
MRVIPRMYELLMRSLDYSFFQLYVVTGGLLQSQSESPFLMLETIRTTISYCSALPAAATSHSPSPGGSRLPPGY